MNTNIPLSGVQFDLGRSMRDGLGLAAGQKAYDQQNALAELYKTQGANIMAGDQNALNALAQFDPAAAYGIKSDQTEMAWREEDRAAAKAEGKRMAEEALAAQAATLTAEQLAAEKQAITEGLSGAAFFYQNKDRAGYESFLTQNGMDPADYPFESFPAHAAKFEGALEALDTFKPAVPPDMTSSQKDYTFYADQETAAGRQPLSFNEWDLQARKAGAANVSTTVGLPGAEPPAGDALRASITDADTMLSMIEAIDTNAALPKVTGAIEGGGGNNVDDMNVAQRAWYGDDGLALIQSIGQLQGNAWLGARALLKGGGQITDYESKKAEGAMARLSRAQGTPQFKAALKDLKDALKDGLEKLKAAQPPAAGATGAAADMSDDDFLKSLGIE